MFKPKSAITARSNTNEIMDLVDIRDNLFERDVRITEVV